MSAEDTTAASSTSTKQQADEAVARGQSYLQDNWQKKLSRRRMTQYQFNTNLSRVTPLTDESPSWERWFGRADMDQGRTHRLGQSYGSDVYQFQR